MTATATEALRRAMVAAIKGDTILMGLLKGKKVYLRRADPNAELPHIVLAAAGEREDSRYGEPGHEGDEGPRCWGIDLAEAGKVWEALYPVLHQRRLQLEGHRMVSAKLVRLTDFSDPDETAHCIVTQYRPKTRELV